MANATKTPKKSFFSRLGTWFVNLPKRIAKAFTGMWHELRKVSWPTRKQLLNYSVLVLIFMVFMGIVIGVLDTGATQLVHLLSK